MTTATSYNGAPAYEDGRNIAPWAVQLPAGVITFPQGLIDNEAFRALATYVVVEWDARIERLPILPATVAGYWGWDYRPNRNNPSVLSCHSSGTGFDIWAVEHPNRADTLTAGEKDTLARIAHETSHEIRFGVPGLICPICGRSAGWTDSSSSDNMHGEATRYDLDAWAAAAAALPGSAPLPPIITTPEDEMTDEQFKQLMSRLDAIDTRDKNTRTAVDQVDERVAQSVNALKATVEGLRTRVDSLIRIEQQKGAQ